MGESVELRDYLGVIGMEWFNLAQTLVTIFIVGEYRKTFHFNTTYNLYRID